MDPLPVDRREITPPAPCRGLDERTSNFWSGITLGAIFCHAETAYDRSKTPHVCAHTKHANVGPRHASTSPQPRKGYLVTACRRSKVPFRAQMSLIFTFQSRNLGYYEEELRVPSTTPRRIYTTRVSDTRLGFFSNHLTTRQTIIPTTRHKNCHETV